MLNEKLLNAAQEGNEQEVLNLLAQGANIEARVVGNQMARFGNANGGYDGYTPLLVAAHWGHLRVVKILLEKKADIHAKTPAGNNGLLFLTAWNDGHQIIRFLFDNYREAMQQQLNSKNSSEQTPLYATIINNSLKTAQLLLDLGADKSLLISGKTVIQHAYDNNPSRNELARLISEHKLPMQPAEQKQEFIQVVSFEVKYNDLTLGKELGEGGFGKVYAGTWHFQPVAVKKLLFKDYSKDAQDEFKNEANIMANLRHDNIVQFRGFCVSPEYCLVMEYMPKGSLFSVLHNANENLGWETRYKIATNIASGLAYLHSQNILHRDIKSLNVLLDEHYKAKLTDFGLSNIKKESKNKSQLTKTKTAQSVGTVQWMAPELFGRSAKYTMKSDVYSLGITLWEITARKLPFEDAHDASVIPGWVKDGERETFPDDCPKKFKSLIEVCWKGKPEERPAAADVAGFFYDKSEDFASYLASKQSAAAVQSRGGYQGNLISFQPAIASGEIKVDVFRSVSSNQVPAVVQSPATPKPVIVEEKENVKNDELSWQEEELVFAAETGNIDAKARLGFMYEMGIGVAKNEVTAMKWYKQVLETPNSVTAMWVLGRCYLKGFLEKSKNEKQATVFFEKAASKGDTRAQNDLGLCYANGIGVSKDMTKAVEWWLKAAAEGHSDAQYNLGTPYCLGQGIAADPVIGANWYEKAAQQNHLQAQYALGVCYANGLGRSKDPAKAKEWFEKAAGQGHEEAKKQLAELKQRFPELFIEGHSPQAAAAALLLAVGGVVIKAPEVKQEEKAPHEDAKTLEKFLRLVAEGEQDQAEAMLKQDKNLALASGKVTDLSERTFNNITAFQYACWAMDWHMWKMLRKYMSNEAAAQQLNALETKGTEHGKRFNLQVLIDALDTYIKNYAAWNRGQCQAHWIKKVGGAQKQLPAHVVNEYCHPDRSFDQFPTFTEDKLPRTRKCRRNKEEGDWFSTVHWGGKIGDNFAFVRWSDSPCPQVDGAVWSWAGAMLDSQVKPDHKSLQNLLKVRTQQLESLRSELSTYLSAQVKASGLRK